MKKLLWIKRHISFLFLGVILIPDLSFSNPIPPAPPETLIRELKAYEDFEHQVGKQGNRGWQVDHRKDLPGYLLSTLREPLLLEPGLYRIKFIVRRGHYPKKGLLHNTYGIFRLELWDTTKGEQIDQRELQMADLTAPNKYETRWMDFSMLNREGHVVEPRIYWMGLANGEVEKIEVVKFPDVSLSHLEDKANRLGRLLESKFLENGFVVSRKSDGSPDETGDATTYTGWYATSLAWHYAATKDPLTLQSLENALQTLHGSIKGTFDRPLLTRYVDGDGVPYAKSGSKDCYTAVYLAYATAYPYLRNEALKKQMALDVERLGNRFLKDGLSFREGNHEILSLNPYFTEEEVRSGIRNLLADKDQYHSFIKNLKAAETYVPFGETWPGAEDVLEALKEKDEEKLVDLTVPTMNGIMNLMERARDILREQYRQDLFPKRSTYRDFPGKKIERLLTEWLQKFPTQKSGNRIDRITDLKVLGSNALISLHLIRTSGELSQKDQFDEYYKTNLYSQDALLQTALDWNNMDEEIVALTAGNPAANKSRKGYLSALSLLNLIRLEKNPAVKESYRIILERWWRNYRHDDNPMAMALAAQCFDQKEKTGFILRALDLYPEDRKGFGSDYWKTYGNQVGEKMGGGTIDKYSAEPLPVSHRPKDSFLWQRNARQLFGDDDSKDYPPTDFLFVYWFCRAHQLIPAVAPASNVKTP